MLEAIFPVHVLAFCASGIRILPCRENLVNLWSIVKIRCILDRGGADEAEYQSIFSFYREERFVLYQPAARLVGRKVSFFLNTFLYLLWEEHTLAKPGNPCFWLKRVLEMNALKLFLVFFMFFCRFRFVCAAVLSQIGH